MRTFYDIAGQYASLLLVGSIAAISWHTWRTWRLELTSMAEPQSGAGPVIDEWPAQPHVSILVAAWNETANIEAFIESFLRLSYPHKELVLCAGGNDGTYELARLYASEQIILLEQAAGEGKQRALQRCLPASAGSIIMLTDADCELSDLAFYELLQPLVSGKTLVATGVSEPKMQQRTIPLVQYQWFTDHWWAARMPPTVDGVLGRNCAIERSILTDIGAFDAEVRTGTDYHLSRLLIQAGYSISAIPQSRVLTEYPASPRDYVRMWRRWNKNLLIHGLRFGAWGDVKGVLTAFLVYSFMFLAPFATLFFGPLLMIPAVILYCLALGQRLRRVLTGARLARVETPWRCILILPFLTILDALAVVRAFIDTVRWRTRLQW
ncbi:MAG: glycosyltransferase family 2 protein [Chloroflexales bacterium]|nr:glycosyltransferase family 2 protein [Chloroflexales bacterium]